MKLVAMTVTWICDCDRMFHDLLLLLVLAKACKILSIITIITTMSIPRAMQVSRDTDPCQQRYPQEESYPLVVLKVTDKYLR